MDFDSYLQQYYGFDTNDRKWKSMSNQGRALLRDSFKMDMAKETQKTKDAGVATSDAVKLAKLYPSSK